MAKSALEATAQEQDSHSPSVEFERLGKDAGQGYVNGIRDKLNDAGNAGKELAQQAMHDAGAFGDVTTTPLYGLGAMNTEPMYGLGDMNTEPIQASIEQWFDFAEAVEQGQEALWNCDEAVIHMDDSIGAIKLQANAAKDAISDFGSATTEVITASEGVGNATRPVADALTEIAANAAGASSAVTEATETINNDSNDLQTAMSVVKDTVDSVSNATDSATSAMQSFGAVSSSVQQAASDFTSVASKISETTSESSALANELKDVDRELKQKKKDAGSASEGFEKFKKVVNGLKKAFPGLYDMFRLFRGNLKRMAIRSIIREIAKAFSEGVENVYHYSKTVGTSFAPAMDAAATSLQYMKNSIGAAVSPLIEMLVPALQSVVNWLVRGVNWLNQFFALLNNQKTWTRALPATTTAFKNQEKAAKGAAAAIKDLLADWDELNIIQGETSGAGGGLNNDAAENYLEMFEEVDTFDDGIRELVDFVKENFGLILAGAIAIKAAISGWRLSAAFQKDLPFLSQLVTGLGLGADIVLSIALTDYTGKQFKKTGDPGWFIADALTGAVGSALAYTLASKLAGAAFGSVTAGFLLVIEGAVNIINAKDAMDEFHEGEAWALGALGSLEAGVGAGLAAYGFGGTLAGSFAVGGWTAAITAAITAVVLLDAKNAAANKKMAYLAFAKKGKNGISVDDYLSELQKRFSELTSGSQLVVDAMIGFDESGKNFKESIESLKSLNEFIVSGESLTETQAKDFKAAWDIVFSELDNLGTISYNTIFHGLEEAIRSGSQTIKEEAEELKKQAVEVAGITGGARAKAKEEMNQIITEIVSGDTSRANRYIELYNIWGGEETQNAVDKFVNGIVSERIALSEENPVADAQNLIQRLQDEFVNPALETAQAQYDSEIKAIEEQKSEIEKAFASGYITETQKEKALESLDNIGSLFKNRLDDQIKQINEAVDNAYGAIAKQAAAGFYDTELTPEARQSYIDNVIAPIAKLFEDANREVPEELKKVMEYYSAFGQEGFGNSKRMQEYADTYGRGATYRALIDSYMSEYGLDEITEANTAKLLTYVFSRIDELNSQAGLQGLTDIDRQDIVNALLSVLPDSMGAEALEYLMSGTFSLNGNNLFGLQDVLSWINWEALGARQRSGETYTMNGETFAYEVETLVDYLNEMIEEYNRSTFGDKMPMISMADMPTPNYDEKTLGEEEMASAITKGMNEANTPTQDQANEIIGLLSQWLNKDFNFTVSPSSGWAMHNEKSRSQFERVNG